MEIDLASPLPEEGWERYGFPPPGHWKYRALRQLLRKSWSSRAWIVQESLLNGRAIMLCGAQVVFNWDLLPNVLRLVTKGTCPQACMSVADDPSTDGASYLHALGNMRRDAMREKTKHTLSQLLRRTHNFRSGKPRDKIYSLLGLADDRDAVGIVPNYSLSERDVLVDAAVRILRIDPVLEILSGVRNNKVLDLPSWVPDWTVADVEKCGTNNYLWFSILVANGLFAAAGQGWAGQIQFSADGEEPTVRGILFDKIRNVIQPSFGHGAGNTERPLRDILAGCLQATEQGEGPSPYGTTADIREAFWRTLIGNMTHMEREAEQDYGQSFGAFLQREDSRARSFELLTLVPVDSETESAASGFRKAANLVSVSECRRRARGLHRFVPNHAQEGDHVCVLLRDAGAGKFNLLGDCYVHRIMKGEAVSNAADDDFMDIILI